MSRYFIVFLFAAVFAAPHEGGEPQGEIQPDADHPWIGKWVSIEGREENFDNFVKALGVGGHYGSGDKVWHKLWKEGDHYHHKIVVPSKGYKNDVQFKLGEQGTASYNGTDFQYKYHEEGKDLHAEYNVASKGKKVHDIYHVEGEELQKTYKTGDVTAKKWYKKASAEDKAKSA